MTLEISTRLGDTLLDVTHVEHGDYTLADTCLVEAGVAVVPPAGHVGLVAYEIREITRPARSIPFASARDHQVLPYLAGALLAHVGVWALATITHPHVEEVTPPGPRPRLVARIVASPSSAVVPDDVARDRTGTKAQGAGRAARGVAGTAGNTQARRERGHIAVQNTGEVAQLSQADAVARARRAGILGHTQVLDETLANLAGTEKLTSALDAMTVDAAAGGSGDARGTFGATPGGSGTGGGGDNVGSIGTATYGALSMGTSGGHGWGGAVRVTTPSWQSWDSGQYHTYAPMPSHLGRARPRYLTICPMGTPCTVDGDIDPAVVRRHVRRQLAKLSSCYEAQLLARAHLRGQVTIAFEIDDGTTANVLTRGFDPEIDACVQRVFEDLDLARGSAHVVYTLRYGPV